MELNTDLELQEILNVKDLFKVLTEKSNIDSEKFIMHLIRTNFHYLNN